MNWALIKNGIVVNVVAWDGEGDLFSDYEVVCIDNMTCGIGWKYEDGVCIPPDDFPFFPGE